MPFDFNKYSYDKFEMNGTLLGNGFYLINDFDMTWFQFRVILNGIDTQLFNGGKYMFF